VGQGGGGKELCSSRLDGRVGPPLLGLSTLMDRISGGGGFIFFRNDGVVCDGDFGGWWSWGICWFFLRFWENDASENSLQRAQKRSGRQASGGLDTAHEGRKDSVTP